MQIQQSPNPDYKFSDFPIIYSSNINMWDISVDYVQ